MRGKNKLESEIQSEILAYLKQAGIFHFKLIHASINGCPDIICCYHGLFIGLEVKRNMNAVISGMQFVQQERIRQAGGQSYFVWSVEMVKEIFDAQHKSDEKAI